jgi:dipeptidyl aminopeptidase/acylaminoacyl peptidase
MNDKWKSILENLTTAFGVDYVGVASMSKDQQKMILSIGDDKNPGDYYLYDRNKNQIAYLGSTRPWIDPKTMAEMQPIEFEARDGETIHGFLSVPVDSDGKNLPLIVNPHGGPFGIQDVWRYNAETQFFVNRGYAVMQVNFRGSGGYGKRHERIGYKRWGLEMQDDISDGVNWAVEEGIADSEHVCIYGASYGGYATMAGITLTPELYRCGVNYVGIWDIKMLYEQNGRWVDRAKRWFHNHVLDPKEDVDQLKKTSPNFHLDNIQAPLLIVHGRRDYNVRIEQAETLMDALDEKDIPYEVLIKKEEGHGFRLEENRVELYTVMEKFFEKNLSKP